MYCAVTHIPWNILTLSFHIPSGPVEPPTASWSATIWYSLAWLDKRQRTCALSAKQDVLKNHFGGWTTGAHAGLFNLMTVHHVPRTISDHIALGVVKAMRVPADLFFARRYGHRAVVLETVAAVPGMVGGVLQHLKSLRSMQNDRGRIKTLLDEAENERMHLMTFIEISRLTWLERMIVLIVQGLMFNLYFLLYLTMPKTCHRIVGYLVDFASPRQTLSPVLSRIVPRTR